MNGHPQEKMPPPAHPALSAEQIAFIGRLRRALVVRGQVVELGEHRFRFVHRGEMFEDGDRVLQAEQTGIFARHPVTRGGAAAGHQWLHMGSSDDLEVLLASHVQDLSTHDMERIGVGLSASHVLTEEERDGQRRAERGG